MSRVRRLPALEDQDRVETGAISFGEDWPGVFIRGGNALSFKMALDRVIGQDDASGSFFCERSIVELQSLAVLLAQCEVKAPKRSLESDSVVCCRADR